MRIILVSQYYPPETGAAQNRVASLARGLVNAGHDVTVIAQKPNYPEGVTWSEYRGGLFREGQFEGARVIYTAICDDRSKTLVSRLMYFTSFMSLAIVASLRIAGKTDIVIASSPPLFVGIAGVVIAKLRRCKFVFDVRDLWPEIAIALGELKSPRAQRLARRMELVIYRNADAITAVTDGFCETIRESAAGTPVFRVSNGSDPARFQLDDSKEDLRRRLHIPDRFVAAYVGNFGLAYDFDHVFDAAQSLLDQAPDILFLIVGSGSKFDQMQARAAQLENVDLRGRVDLDTAIEYMSAADVLLCPVHDVHFHHKTVPAKLYDSMAAARPLLLSLGGESRSLLELANAGWFYDGGDETALPNLLLQARSMSTADLDMLGENGVRFVNRFYSRSVQAARMVQIAEHLVSGKGELSEIIDSGRDSFGDTQMEGHGVGKIAS